MRIYLAAPGGMYQNKGTAAARGGASLVHRVLLSYLPEFKSVDPLLNALDRSAEPQDYCVDSGAHVWINAYFKKAELPPVQRVEDSIRRFVQSVKLLPRKPSFVVEMDLQRLYGNAAVDAWRKEIWMPFERETGIRVVYVWHPTDEMMGWGNMLQNEDMRYLGLASGKNISDDQRVFMVKAAYNAGKPVHGFAAINVRWIKAAPYYSVDSTSWSVSAQAFGTAVLFNHNTGGLTRHRVGNSQVRKNADIAALGLIQTGLHASDVLDRGRGKNEKNYARFHESAAEPYRQLEEWHTARWIGKGVDWEARLERSGHTVPNYRGGHLKAAGL